MIDMVTMNVTRKRVLRGIRELSRIKDRVTYAELGSYADCSAKTAQRAVAELISMKRVERISGQHAGNRYRILGKQHAHADH